MKHTLFLSALLLSGCAGLPKPPVTETPLGRVASEVQQAGLAAPAVTSGQPRVVPEDISHPVLGVPTATPKEPRFSVHMNKAPAAQVFRAAASGTGFNMMVHPDVSGILTVDLENVTLKETLDALRHLYGYDYRIEGQIITVYPNTMQTRMFQVSYLAGSRSGRSDLRVSSSSLSNTNPASGATGTSPTQQKNDASQVVTQFDNNFWGELKSALQTLVGDTEGRKVLVNPTSGMVVVTGLPKEIHQVERYLDTTQKVVARQVMLEAKILEVSLNDSFQTGINWALAGNWSGHFLLNSNLGGATFPPNTSGAPLFGNTTAQYGALALGEVTKPAGLAFQSKDFAAVLQFLETQGNLQVLSSPRIATLNNQKAVLKVGTDEFFVTNVSTTTTASTTAVSTPSLTLQPFFSGISLDVTPQISADDTVLLHVHPMISRVTEKQKNIDLGSMGQYTLPLASSSINETDSIVRIPNGYIVAIGGLFTQEQINGDEGLPGTRDAPGLQDFFGKRNQSRSKRELVVLLKPTLLNNVQNWARETEEALQHLPKR